MRNAESWIKFWGDFVKDETVKVSDEFVAQRPVQSSPVLVIITAVNHLCTDIDFLICQNTAFNYWQYMFPKSVKNAQT